MTTPPSSGWYDDPTGRYSSRYWNGQQWTNQVNSGGANAIDEPPSNLLFVPPAPGTESGGAPAPQPTVQVSQPAPRSAVGTVVAVVLGIIAVLVVVFVLVNQSDDSDSTTPTEPPATTEAPPSDG